MPDSFSAKFALVLKALSISRGRLAADLGVDKSVVGRWATGVVKPSDHNLSRLTALVAERLAGFTALDWDRSSGDFASLIGASPNAVAGLPLPVLEQILATTALRASAYEGFFRSTRPYVLQPDRFVHDHGMLRLDDQGLLALRIGTAGSLVEGWMLPMGNQLYCIAAQVALGSLLFGIFNGVASTRAQVLDGIVLTPALDSGRTPTSHAMMFERIGDLSGNVEADDAEFERLAALDPLAPQGSISDGMRAHLVRDIGPAAAALGGDMLLRLPLDRTIARGPAYGEDQSA